MPEILADADSYAKCLLSYAILRCPPTRKRVFVGILAQNLLTPFGGPDFGRTGKSRGGARQRDAAGDGRRQIVAACA
jgi:hypothetical protein